MQIVSFFKHLRHNKFSFYIEFTTNINNSIFHIDVMLKLLSHHNLCPKLQMVQRRDAVDFVRETNVSRLLVYIPHVHVTQ